MIVAVPDGPGAPIAAYRPTAYEGRVLIRLLLALLLASFAVPAAAPPACHGGDDAMAMAMVSGPGPAMHHGAVPASDPLPPPHACAGCVPLADWLGERVPAPILPAAIAPVAWIATLDPGDHGLPVLRPPRQG